MTKNDGPFYCPECFSDAVVRKCTDKVDHFAHKTTLSPAVGAEETELHDNCKREICSALARQYPEGSWVVERPMPANASKKLDKVVPDISGRINGHPVIVEVQASALTIPSIIKRTANYSRRQCNVLWIVPLKDGIGGSAFRPRLYERYFHSMYFGRTYYWLEGYGAEVVPVHYGIATRYIECRSWFDSEYKEEMSAGGYDKPYKIVKEPLAGTRLAIGSAFKPRKRAEFIPYNAKKAIPACSVWLDNLEPWWPQQLEARTATDYYRYE